MTCPWSGSGADPIAVAGVIGVAHTFAIKEASCQAGDDVLAVYFLQVSRPPEQFCECWDAEGYCSGPGGPAPAGSGFHDPAQSAGSQASGGAIGYPCGGYHQAFG